MSYSADYLDNVSNYCPSEDDSVNSIAPLTDNSIKPRIPIITEKLILYIPVFCVFFALNLSATVFQNQLLYQSCIVIFHYSDEECQTLLGITKSNENASAIEDIVQPYVARILMTRSLIESLIPAFISLIIGSWTDNYGRRPIMLFSFIGVLISYIVSCAIAGISMHVQTNPYIYIVSTIPYALCGGTCVLMTVVYSYITDISPEEKIPPRMFLNYAAIGLGSVAGNLSSGSIFIKTNMAVVFGISSGALLIATIYIYIFAVESLNVQRTSVLEKIKGLFSISLLKDIFRTSFKHRTDLIHVFLWFSIITMVLITFVAGGESNIFYLFVRKQFDWTIEEFTIYNSISTGIQVVGGVVGILIFRKFLKLSTVVMALIALSCFLAQSIVRSIAFHSWELYLASSLGFMSGLSNPMVLAVLTHLVLPLERGKIFAVTSSMITIAPLISSPIYTSVYNATLNIHPGLFNIISSVLYLICVIFLSTMFFIRRSKGLPTI